MLPRFFLIAMIVAFAAPVYAAESFPVKVKELNKPQTTANAPVKIDAPFDRLQGKAWALVLTGPDIDPLFVEQLAMLTPEAAALIAREMVIIHFNGRTLHLYPELSVFQYELPSLNGSKKGMSSHRKINMLESQLQTDDDVFSVVLVDKTGRVIYVWKEPVRPAALFAMMDNPVAMTQKKDTQTKP